MKNKKEELEYWEKILEQEWLWDIDVKEGFKEKIHDILHFKNEKKFQDFLEKFQEENDLKVEFDDYNASITFFDKKTWERIGFIRPGNYSYNWIEKTNHLEKVIEPAFRGRWLGKKLVEIFINYWKVKWYKNFTLPEKEYSHKLSTISMMINDFWYDITWKFIDWVRLEVDDFEIDRILLEKKEHLENTYELTKRSNEKILSFFVIKFWLNKKIYYL